jgi:pimeloyl-ACP methyl ester carboxylesterase
MSVEQKLLPPTPSLLLLEDTTTHTNPPPPEACNNSYYNSWFSSFFPKYDIDEELAKLETTILKTLEIDYEQYFVEAGDHRINTIRMGSGPPLVLWHGFGAGIGFWQRNLKEFAQHHTVYAIDLPGFGRSNRTNFEATDSEDSENHFIQALEDWCEKLCLQNFVLVGHSFGAYLAGCYSLKHPDRVKKIVFADPWGFPEVPPDFEKNRSYRWAAISRIARLIESPFAAVRSFGHYYGPKVIATFRPDLERKWINVGEAGLISRYIYLLNASVPATGERAFFKFMTTLGFSNRPLFHRLRTLDKRIPVYLLYGSHTWMDKNCGRALRDILGNRAQMCIIRESGHHIYCDNPQEFNDAVLYASVDNPFSLPKPNYF